MRSLAASSGRWRCETSCCSPTWRWWRRRSSGLGRPQLRRQIVAVSRRTSLRRRASPFARDPAAYESPRQLAELDLDSAPHGKDRARRLVLLLHLAGFVPLRLAQPAVAFPELLLGFLQVLAFQLRDQAGGRVVDRDRPIAGRGRRALDNVGRAGRGEAAPAAASSRLTLGRPDASSAAAAVVAAAP